MPAYRFCRPDDIPLLVRAVNLCHDVHFPDRPPLTVDAYRREMKELDAWPSNSMLALGGPGGDEPVAVSLGTKREREVLVHRLGVRPDERRRGHGAHLLASLSQKLAVLGPERLVAEVPDDLEAAGALLAAAGWRREDELVDWLRPAGGVAGGPQGPAGLVIPMAVEQVLADGVLAVAEDASWRRSRRTLEQSADRLEALAIATPDGVEAAVVHAPPEGSGPADVLAAGCRDRGRAPLLLGLLFDALARASGRALRWPRALVGELPPELLAGAGFGPARRHHRWSAVARAL